MEYRIIAIDLGSSQAKITAAKIDTAPNSAQKSAQKSSTNIFHTGIMDSQGIRRGQVQSPDMAQKVVNNLLASQKLLPTENTVVCVSINGTSFSTTVQKPKVDLKRMMVADKHLDTIRKKAREMSNDTLDDDYTLFDIASSGFSVDNSPLSTKVKGIEGSMLDGRFVCYTCRKETERVLKELLQRYDSSKISFHTPSRAAATLLFVNKNKRKGSTIVVDLGGQTTGVVGYYENMFRCEICIPIGSDTITNDIAAAMDIPLADAEKIKQSMGIPSATNTNDVLNFYDLPCGHPVEVHLAKLEYCIRARVEEIIAYVDSAIGQCINQGCKGDINLMLVGGGSKLKGIKEAFARILNREVTEIKDLPGNVPIEYMSTTGMIYLESKELSRKDRKPEQGTLFDNPETTTTGTTSGSSTVAPMPPTGEDKTPETPKEGEHKDPEDRNAPGNNGGFRERVGRFFDGLGNTLFGDDNDYLKQN